MYVLGGHAAARATSLARLGEFTADLLGLTDVIYEDTVDLATLWDAYTHTHTHTHTHTEAYTLGLPHTPLLPRPVSRHLALAVALT